MYTSNPTTGTKHYVYLNGASLLSVACHNRINPTPFRLAGSPPNTASVLPLSLFSLSRYICRRPGTIQAQAFPRRKGRESLLVFRLTMYPLEGHASPRTNTRTQEAIKSRNVFAWRRHVGRGESATTAVSSNGSFQEAPANRKGINRDNCFTYPPPLCISSSSCWSLLMGPFHLV